MRIAALAAVLVVAAGLVVAGVAQWSVAVALVVAGVELAALGVLFLVDVDRKPRRLQDRPPP